MSDLETPDIEPEDVEGEPALESTYQRPPQFADEAALFNSYLHAQRKITAQGQELADLRNQIAALQEPEYLPDDGNEYGWEADDYVAQPPADPAMIQAHLRAAANVAAETVRAQLGQSNSITGLTPDDSEQFLDATERLVRAVQPNWSEEWKDRVSTAIQESPEHQQHLEMAWQTQDPSQVAAALLSAQRDLAAADAQEKASSEMRRLAALAPNNAGRITSASGDAAEWDKIKNALSPMDRYLRGR